LIALVSVALRCRTSICGLWAWPEIAGLAAVAAGAFFRGQGGIAPAPVGGMLCFRHSAAPTRRRALAGMGNGRTLLALPNLGPTSRDIDVVMVSDIGAVVMDSDTGESGTQ
jgi:hypothetical protein